MDEQSPPEASPRSRPERQSDDGIDLASLRARLKAKLPRAATAAGPEAEDESTIETEFHEISPRLRTSHKAEPVQEIDSSDVVLLSSEEETRELEIGMPDELADIDLPVPPDDEWAAMPGTEPSISRANPPRPQMPAPAYPQHPERHAAAESATSGVADQSGLRTEALLGAATTMAFAFGAIAIMLAAIIGWYAPGSPLLLYLVSVVPIVLAGVIVVRGVDRIVQSLVNPTVAIGLAIGLVLCSAWMIPSLRAQVIGWVDDDVVERALEDKNMMVSARACAEVLRHDVNVGRAIVVQIVEMLPPEALAACAAELQGPAADSIATHTVRRFERELADADAATPTCAQVGLLQEMTLQPERRTGALWSCVAAHEAGEVRACCASDLAETPDVAETVAQLPADVRGRVAAWLLATGFHQTNLTADQQQAAGILQAKSAPMRTAALRAACDAVDDGENATVMKHVRATISTSCDDFSGEVIEQMKTHEWLRVCDAMNDHVKLCDAVYQGVVASAVEVAQGLLIGASTSYTFSSNTEGIHAGFASEIRESQTQEARFASLLDRIESVEDRNRRSDEARAAAKLRREEQMINRLERAMRQETLRDAEGNQITSDRVRELRQQARERARGAR